MKKALVSIIIAAYNRQNYIRSAIQSILQQTYPHFELIVIDDGSTDTTSEIINSFRDSRIQYYWKKHTRCWDTKNNGLLHANGDFILFLDSDDYLSKNYLEIGLKTINKYPSHEYFYPERLHIVRADGSSSNSSWRYMDVQIKDRWKLINIFLKEAIAGIPHPGAFIRPQVFKKCGFFDENLFNFGDSAYIVKNALNIRFKMIPHLQYYFNRQHAAQTNKSWHHRSQTIADLMEYIIQNYPRHFHVPGIEMISSELEQQKILNKYYVNRFINQSKNYPDYKTPFLINAQKYIKKLRNLDEEIINFVPIEQILAINQRF